MRLNLKLELPIPSIDRFLFTLQSIYVYIPYIAHCVLSDPAHTHHLHLQSAFVCLITSRYALRPGGCSTVHTLIYRNRRQLQVASINRHGQRVLEFPVRTCSVGAACVCIPCNCFCKGIADCKKTEK